MHYNFAGVHKTLRITPAMAAGITDHVWSLEEIRSTRKLNRIIGMKDAKAAAVLGAIWLVWSLFMVLRPTKAQTIMDGYADWFKKGSWHPLRGMPSWLIRGLGATVCAGAALFFYISINSN